MLHRHCTGTKIQTYTHCVHTIHSFGNIIYTQEHCRLLELKYWGILAIDWCWNLMHEEAEGVCIDRWWTAHRTRMAMIPRSLQENNYFSIVTITTTSKHVYISYFMCKNILRDYFPPPPVFQLPLCKYYILSLCGVVVTLLHKFL